MEDLLEFGVFVAIVSAAIFTFRASSVWIRRWDKKDIDGPSADALDRRVAELEEWQAQRMDENEQRIAELEERLDFTERLLGETRRQTELPRGE